MKPDLLKSVVFLVHLSRRLKCTIVITRCPSSVDVVRRPSVVVNFSHFQLLLWCKKNVPLNGIQRNLIGSKILMSPTKFVFFGPIKKTRWPPCSLIGWDISDFSSETAERNSTKLYSKQDLNVLYQVCVFGLLGKPRWPPWPLIGGDTLTTPLDYIVAHLTKSIHWRFNI